MQVRVRSCRYAHVRAPNALGGSRRREDNKWIFGPTFPHATCGNPPTPKCRRALIVTGHTAAGRDRRRTGLPGNSSGPAQAASAPDRVGSSAFAAHELIAQDLALLAADELAKHVPRHLLRVVGLLVDPRPLLTPSIARKSVLRVLEARCHRRRINGIFLSDFEQGEIGPDLFRHACLMGLEGLVSKHRDRPYRAGRSPHWVKVKNREHPAMSRIQKSLGTGGFTNAPPGDRVGMG